MLRVLAIAAMFALAVPTLAAAEEHHDDHHGGPPHAGGPPHPPPAHGPAVVHPHGPPPGAMAHPHGPPPGAMGHPGGPPGAQFGYHGHMVARVHRDPFVYPQGWAYRRWAVGAMLPPLFLARDYWYADWAALGLAPPPPGFQWVRYGPDLLLVDVTSGQVAEVVPDVFY
jgi:Nickel/cobalt transporter regulator